MSLSENLETIRARIRAACERSERAEDSVRLLAVSKGHPAEAVLEAAELGLDAFGESRVQEIKEKAGRCPAHLRWHMIGHLQTNKCRDAVHLFHMIHSVDSLHLAEEINKNADRSAKSMPILLQANVAGEAQKYGYAPDTLLDELDDVNALDHLEIHGLMCIAPYSEDPERSRAFFRRLRELKETCEQRLGAPLPHLSMGMSGDFETAIEEGATLLRVGTSLFGARTHRK